MGQRRPQPLPPDAPAGLATSGDALAVVPGGTAAPPHIPQQIFAAAVDAHISGQRLDMKSLARRLGVSRATLYRQAGNREQLLDEVIWWRARHTLAEQIHATATLAGAARIVAAVGGVLQAIERDRSLRTFLESDPEAALRILTGTRSTVQRGMVAALENLIDLERGRGAFDADLDTPTLAYAIVRIAEGFLYADVIADRSPDIARATTVIEALLRGLDLMHRAPGTHV
ncbi:MAG TPA: QsdR family transcriptional regulator [Streptosporangiaceae bacterium]